MKTINGSFFILLCTALLTIGGCSKKNTSPKVSPSKAMQQKMKAFNKKFKKANKEWEKGNTKINLDSLPPNATHEDSVLFYNLHPNKRPEDFHE